MLSQRPHLSSVADMSALAVHRDMRRKGVAINLTEVNLLALKEKGISLARVMCTSGYSRKVCQKLGFTLELEVDLTQLKDAKNEPLFVKPEFPIAALFTMDLNEK